MLRLRGLVVAAVIVVVAVFTTQYAQGRFADRFELTIDAATLGEGLAPGAEVKFRGYGIGTVRKVETVGYGHQRIELSLDRVQAGALTDDVSARFTSSNIFGSSAIELVNNGRGGRLPENTTLFIGENASNATVASVFRRAARLTQVLDSQTVRALFDLLLDNTAALGPTVRSFFATARVLATNQRAPLGHYLEIGADVGTGVAQTTPPVVDVILGVLDNSAYFGTAENRERTKLSLSGLDTALLLPVADLLRRDNPDLAAIIGGVLDLAVPISASIGTVAPAYHRLPALLERIGDAFPMVDGRVQLQLELIVKNMPYLADSVIGAPR
ncbi:ABC-type transporter Mla subunit MlaD [Nocardia tenerifensis]|uniref:ABC-type transporter Mla subunit MlaD n=2 Tax=Nocardia tenerifensis TaxID=228006 RepID=A0A318KAC3_9NOCA|nr:ABC-type transporter Mla subunit MlaD [Nocardia tenerifensis]